MKILIGHPGLRGDLALNVPAIEFLSQHTSYVIDMPVHKQFADMLPLFANHSAFNPVVIDGYDTFPTERDKTLIKMRGYTRVFDPMLPHRDEWWQFRHQTSAVLWDYVNVELPLDCQQINLVQWFDVEKRGNWVAFAPFAGWSHERKNDKMLLVEKAQEIVSELIVRGYQVLQLGGSDEPRLEHTTFIASSYFESVRNMLGCKMLLTTDTGITWVASGYKFPTVALYGHRYYGSDKVGNIQPRNPNALYLDSKTVNEIPLDIIMQTVDTLLNTL